MNDLEQSILGFLMGISFFFLLFPLIVKVAESIFFLLFPLIVKVTEKIIDKFK